MGAGGNAHKEVNIDNQKKNIISFHKIDNCINLFIHSVDEYKPEKKLKDHGKSVNKRQLKIIVLQMEICICKIHCNDGSYGTGFFCRIPFPDYNCYKNPLKVLITNNHILKQEDIYPGKKIKYL